MCSLKIGARSSTGLDTDMITQRRAREIEEKAKEITNVGPWSDQISRVITPGEDEEIRNLWSLMAGNTCYMDAFARFCAGTAYSKKTHDNAIQNVKAVASYIDGYVSSLVDCASEHTEMGARDAVRVLVILEQAMRKMREE